jgi:ubiquinone biosynthesis protein COQ9
MALLIATPPYTVRGLKELGQFIDDIWYYAGDRSIDMSWYTKRAILMSLYVSTELYMMKDRSTGFAETYAFLDRRFGDIKQFGMWKFELTNMTTTCLKTMQGIINPVSN